MKARVAALVVGLGVLVWGFSVAQAHWVARQIFANQVWWAIHYDMGSTWTGIEFFQSLGPEATYWADAYLPPTAAEAQRSADGEPSSQDDAEAELASMRAAEVERGDAA